MATKKAASTAKKSTTKKSTTAAKQTTTNVTTVKAVESRPMTVSAPVNTSSKKFNIRSTSHVAALIAEFVGTFIFAAAVVAGQGQPILVFFALTGTVLAVGALSGAYLNPALTVAAWVTRRMTGMRALGYIVAQFLGAMLALTLLDMFVKAAPAASANDLYSAAPTLFHAAALPAGKEWYIFLAELVGATVFGFAVAAATREVKERTAAAFTVGIGVFLGLMVAGSAAAFLGGSAILNPAVAVSLQAINFQTVWPIAIYVVGASIGAIIGFVLYDYLRSAEQKQSA
jgi:glycerol uptake facilitator-like aquaporin